MQQSVSRSVGNFGDMSEFPATPDEIGAHAPARPRVLSGGTKRHHAALVAASSCAPREECFSKSFLQPGLFDTPFEENATNEKIWILSAMPLLVPTTRSVRRQQTRLLLHLLSSDAPCVVNKTEGH